MNLQYFSKQLCKSVSAIGEKLLPHCIWRYIEFDVYMLWTVWCLFRRSVGMCGIKPSLFSIWEIIVDTEVEVVVWAACLSSRRCLLSTKLCTWLVEQFTFLFGTNGVKFDLDDSVPDLIPISAKCSSEGRRSSKSPISNLNTGTCILLATILAPKKRNSHRKTGNTT